MVHDKFLLLRVVNKHCTAHGEGHFAGIARLELGAKQMDSFSRFNGKPAAGIQIYQAPGANAIRTAEGVARADSVAIYSGALEIR